MGVRKNIFEVKKQQNSPDKSPKGSERVVAGHSHEVHDVELDLIERLKANILMLDDLQKRLGFMNSELESVLGSRLKS